MNELQHYTQRDIHNLEPVGFADYYALVPQDLDDDIKVEMRSVFAKNYLGLKSIDYVKKRYFEGIFKSRSTPKTPNPFETFLNKLTTIIWNLFNEIDKTRGSLDFTNGTGISLGLQSSLSRLRNSYESALFLIKSQLFFESISINRMIFEQLNYCFNLSHLTKENFENLSPAKLRKKLSPTDINKLKKFIPKSKLGYFYSYLSENTHIDYKRVANYLSFEQEIDDYTITVKSIVQSAESAIILLKIVDIHTIVFEYTLRDFITDDFTSIIRSDNGYIPNDERKSRKILIDLSDEFNELCENVEVPRRFLNTPVK